LPAGLSILLAEACSMTDVTNTFLLVYAALFPIVNPVGSAPIFLALTTRYGQVTRDNLARRVAVNSFVLLLGSLFIGSHVLGFFGITVPVLRIAGGLAVSSFGWRLLRDGIEPSHDPGPVLEEDRVEAFYPLTMPLTVGPGSISVAITIGAQRPQNLALTDAVILGAAAAVALFAISVTVLLCYRFADRMVALLGPSGISVLVRLSAFILLCIGIQIIWSGYSVLMGLPSG
jgi:multiple antibiotic resistance protein